MSTTRPQPEWRNRLVAGAALFSLALPGCAVIMAATDAPEVHYQAIGQGSPRQLLIDILSPPVNTYALTNGGRFDRYEFKAGMGDRALRAVGWAIADGLTLGASELIGTPFEAVKRADTLRGYALFDPQDLLVAMEIRKESGEPIWVVGDSRNLARPIAQTAALQASSQPTDPQSAASAQSAADAPEPPSASKIDTEPAPVSAPPSSSLMASAEGLVTYRSKRRCGTAGIEVVFQHDTRNSVITALDTLNYCIDESANWTKVTDWTELASDISVSGDGTFSYKGPYGTLLEGKIDGRNKRASGTVTQPLMPVCVDAADFHECTAWEADPVD